MFKTPALVLLPNKLSDNYPWQAHLPAQLKEVVDSLKGLFVENEKSARRFLREFISHERLQAFELVRIDEHSSKTEMQEAMDRIQADERWGVLSEAGLTCLADPGSYLVYLAHQKKIFVECYPGPSAIVMALQLSGFYSQTFCFRGYLPREEPLLKNHLHKLEKSVSEGAQLWIEAPYRTDKLIQIALNTFHPDTLFCVIYDIGYPDYQIINKPVKLWSKQIVIGKKPAVFLIGKPD